MRRNRGIGSCFTGTCVAAAILLSNSVAACSRPKQKVDALAGMPGAVVMAVQQAKKDGRTTTSVSTTVDSPHSYTLSEELAAGSAIVVSVKQVNAAITTDNAFVSWTVFSVDREIGPQTLRPNDCFDQVPASLHLSDKDIAVGFLGGVKDIDGVTVTWESADSHLDLKTDAKYLLLGVRCSDHQVQTRNPGYSIVGVSGSGEFQPLPNQSEPVYPPFFKELIELRSLKGLEERMRIQKQDGGR